MEQVAVISRRDAAIQRNVFKSRVSDLANDRAYKSESNGYQGVRVHSGS